MPTVKRPRKGSKAYYPKKRARRIYPRIRTWPSLKDVKPLGFAGYKAGMTHAMLIDTNPHSKTKGQLVSVPLTILECPPITVFGIRIYSTNNVFDVFSDKFDKDLERKIKFPKKQKSVEEQLNKIPKDVNHVNLICHTNPTFKKKPEIFEIALGGSPSEQLSYATKVLGKKLEITEIFKEGDYVDVSGVTKGKGFEGPVKRFGIRILGRKYQQMERHTGSLGQTEPGKVRYTVPQAGQLGFFTRTEFNKRIVKIFDEFKVKGGLVGFGNVSKHAVLLEGSVVGAKKRLIRLRFPIRPPKTKYPIEIKYISLESKQGV